MRRLLVVSLLLSVACVPDGRDRTGQPLVDPMSRVDGGTRTSTPTDAGDLSDTGLTPIDGGMRMPDAALPAPDAGPPDSGPPAPYCGDQVCAGNETCMNCEADCGSCACSAGFILNAGRCAPESLEPFVSRLESEVCEHWRTEFVQNVGTEWTAVSGDMCDLGDLSEASRANALRRTNLYRWLAGLGPVTENVSLRPAQQACAIVQKAQGALNHTPPNTAPCWTQEAYNGASSSNLAQSGGGLAISVDLYIAERNVASLGHRRWVLNPSMVQTSFGYKPPYSCMYSFSRGQNTPQDVQAYPPPGYVPVQAAQGIWSFRMDSIRFVAATTVVEMNVDDAGWQPVESSVIGGGYGAGPVLGWSAPRNTWSAGKVAQVRLTSAQGQTYGYTVVFAGCN